MQPQAHADRPCAKGSWQGAAALVPCCIMSPKRGVPEHRGSRRADGERSLGRPVLYPEHGATSVTYTPNRGPSQPSVTSRTFA